MPSNKTFPQLTNIQDHTTREALKKHWDRTHEHTDSIQALQTAKASLEAKVASLESQIVKLQSQIVQALKTSTS